MPRHSAAVSPRRHSLRGFCSPRIGVRRPWAARCTPRSRSRSWLTALWTSLELLKCSGAVGTVAGGFLRLSDELAHPPADPMGKSWTRPMAVVAGPVSARDALEALAVGVAADVAYQR